jgi:uncharacterized membrane protein YoaK (UPF0700 family)
VSEHSPSPESLPTAEADLDARFFPEVVAIVILLSATSGIVDAVAYQRFGVFVANQTGNLVIVAVDVIEQTALASAALSLVALVSFVIGVFGAMALRVALLRRGSPTRTRVILLSIETALIAIVALGVVLGGEERTKFVAVTLLSVSQAVQAVVIMRIVGIAIQTVVINTALVQSATWWFGGRRKAALVAFSTPVGYLVGAVIGAFLTRLPPPTALSSALLTALASMLVARHIRSRGALIE